MSFPLFLDLLQPWDANETQGGVVRRAAALSRLTRSLNFLEQRIPPRERGPCNLTAPADVGLCAALSLGLFDRVGRPFWLRYNQPTAEQVLWKRMSGEYPLSACVRVERRAQGQR
jgi:hypothetical protein